MMGVISIGVFVSGVVLLWYFHPKRVSIKSLPKGRWKIVVNENLERVAYEGCGRSWQRVSDGEDVEEWKSKMFAEVQTRVENKMGKN